MTFSDLETSVHILVTEKLMEKAGYPLRDSWKGWNGENLDDLHVNSGIDGPRKLSIVSKPEGSPATASDESRYLWDGCEHYSYNNYRIEIPEPYFQSRVNVLIHELVHFIQVARPDDAAYIESTKDNYAEYTAQRCELEAHFVQLLFIVRHEQHLIPDAVKTEFLAMFEEAMLDKAKRTDLILYASSKDII